MLHHARGLGGGDHGAAVLQRGAQRLFAEHRLAKREGRLGDGAVRALRRGDHHRLDGGSSTSSRQSAVARAKP
jgi:hypothetical protein